MPLSAAFSYPACLPVCLATCLRVCVWCPMSAVDVTCLFTLSVCLPVSPLLQCYSSTCAAPAATVRPEAMPLFCLSTAHLCSSLHSLTVSLSLSNRHMPPSSFRSFFEGEPRLRLLSCCCGCASLFRCLSLLFCYLHQSMPAAMPMAAVLGISLIDRKKEAKKRR